MRRLHRAVVSSAGVTAMLESGRDCVEILPQLVAVSYAINGAGFVIVRLGLQHGASPQGAGIEQTRTVAQLEKLFLSLT